jgi:hypothetical protein
MRGTLIVIAATAVLALIVPASAEDAFIGVPGVAGVEIGSGHPGYYRDYDWRRDHYRTEGFDRSYGERCRVTIIRHSDGTTTRDRRCRD